MGTYTTNKNLFMPTVGEQGWGTLVNGNFETIDTYLKPINLSGSTYTFSGNHVGNQSGGSISATSITNSGTLTSTGKITANGGIGATSLTTSSTITSTGQIVANGGVKGNLTGNVQGFLFVKGNVQTSGDEQYATCAAVSFNVSNTNNSSNKVTHTVPNYSISFGNPKKHTWGVYTRRSDLTGTTSPSVSNRAYTFTVESGKSGYLYWKKTTDSNWQNVLLSSNGTTSKTVNLTVGATYEFYHSSYGVGVGGYTITAPALTTYKVKYTTP